MKNETKIGLKNAGSQIALQAVLIPVIGTAVGFFTQKFLISREQKKQGQLAQPQTSEKDIVDFD